MRFNAHYNVQCRVHGLQAYAYQNHLLDKLNIVNLSKLPKSEILRQGERRPVEHDQIQISYFADNGTADDFIAAMRTVLDRADVRDVERELGLEEAPTLPVCEDSDSVLATQATRGSTPSWRSSVEPSQDYDNADYSSFGSPGTPPPITPAHLRQSATPSTISHRSRSASPVRTNRGSHGIANATQRARKRLNIQDAVAELRLAIDEVGYEFWAGRSIPTLENLMGFVADPITDASVSEKGRTLLLKLGLQPSLALRVARHKEMQGIWPPTSSHGNTCRKCYLYAQIDCTWSLCSRHCVDIGGLGASCDEEYHFARTVNTSTSLLFWTIPV